MPGDLEKPAAQSGFADRRIFRESRCSEQAEVSAIFQEANLSFQAPKESAQGAAADAGAPRVHLCEQGGEVLAVMRWRNLGREAEILDLAVPVEHRRQGHARFLLENFLALARTRGISDVFLEVRESNGPAKALYRKLGFSLAGRRPNYYRSPDEAALLLHLKITG